MPELPYAPEALAPKMSKETFDYHYGKHLQTYVNNLNNLIAGTPYEEMPLDEIVRKADGGIFNNAAQAWNHTFFFRMLTPAQQPMPAKLAAKLTEAFGSVEAFKEQFTKAAVGLFGSGWAWLAMDKAGKLSIVAKPNAGNPMTDGLRPVMTVDVWEHAYYIDYRNRRPDFLAAFWELIDWQKVADRCIPKRYQVHGLRLRLRPGEGRSRDGHRAGDAFRGDSRRLDLPDLRTLQDRLRGCRGVNEKPPRFLEGPRKPESERTLLELLDETVDAPQLLRNLDRLRAVRHALVAARCNGSPAGVWEPSGRNR